MSAGCGGGGGCGGPDNPPGWSRALRQVTISFTWALTAEHSSKTLLNLMHLSHSTATPPLSLLLHSHSITSPVSSTTTPSESSLLCQPHLTLLSILLRPHSTSPLPDVFPTPDHFAEWLQLSPSFLSFLVSVLAYSLSISVSLIHVLIPSNCAAYPELLLFFFSSFPFPHEFFLTPLFIPLYISFFLCVLDDSVPLVMLRVKAWRGRVITVMGLLTVAGEQMLKCQVK